MLGIIERFGSVTITLYDHEDDLGAPPAYSSYQDLPSGGAADGRGTAQSRTGRRAIRKRGELMASTRTELQTLADALLALREKRAELYVRLPDDTVRSMTARCDNVIMPTTYQHSLFVPVEIIWSGLDPYWKGEQHGGGWLWDGGELWDSGAVWNEATGNVFALVAGVGAVIAVVNSGNAPLVRPILSITAGSAAITTLEITATLPDGEIDLLFAPDIAAGKTLVIDQGRRIVTNDGVDARGDLVRDPTHTIAEWLRFEPGTTNVTIAIAGGGAGATATVSGFDGWNG